MNKSGTASEVLALPTGGGAIQGIGETFQPNLFSGTGNHSIPIAISLGVAVLGQASPFNTAPAMFSPMWNW